MHLTTKPPGLSRGELTALQITVPARTVKARLAPEGCAWRTRFVLPLARSDGEQALFLPNLVASIAMRFSSIAQNTLCC